jgi:hypothetical protein
VRGLAPWNRKSHVIKSERVKQPPPTPQHPQLPAIHQLHLTLFSIITLCNIAFTLRNVSYNGTSSVICCSTVFKYFSRASVSEQFDT